jgi:nuclear respiratory factor 1
MIMADLESALAQHAPPPPQEDPNRHELPPLVIDGIPTPVEKMTQAQLRAFIPLMLKYSTGMQNRPDILLYYIAAQEL